MHIFKTWNRKRGKQDAEEQKLHVAMLLAIFKATFDDPMPDMNMDIYKTVITSRQPESCDCNPLKIQ